MADRDFPTRDRDQNRDELIGFILCGERGEVSECGAGGVPLAAVETISLSIAGQPSVDLAGLGATLFSMRTGKELAREHML